MSRLEDVDRVREEAGKVVQHWAALCGQYKAAMSPEVRDRLATEIEKTGLATPDDRMTIGGLKSLNRAAAEHWARLGQDDVLWCFWWDGAVYLAARWDSESPAFVYDRTAGEWRSEGTGSCGRMGR